MCGCHVPQSGINVSAAQFLTHTQTQIHARPLVTLLSLILSQLPHFINSSLPAHERLTAQQIDSYLRQELIYKRNERMARRVSALLQRKPTQSFFFAFGAGESHKTYSHHALIYS